MRIVFLLPGTSVRPTGGFKVVYEYANRLTGAGHEVSLIHPWSCQRPPSSLGERLRARRWIAGQRLRPAHIAPWFDFDPGVSLRVVDFPSLERIPEAEVMVATAWHTAPL